jgi:hypothetical protein
MEASAELRRLRYLAAMGVPVYVTRRALPAAAVTRKLVLKPGATAVPPVAQTLPTPTRVEKRVASAPPQAAALRESLREVSPRTAPESAARRSGRETLTQGSPETAPRPGVAANAVRFRLAALVCAERLWLEELGDEALAQEQLQLVAGIGYALMHPRPFEDAVTVTEFQWPMHDNLQLDLGPEEARASLQGFLQRQLDDHACVELICLGNAAADLLKGMRLPCAQRRLPASREVLGNPSIKRDLWQALRS